ncbi:MAG: lamin tail domain-containing protein [Caldilineaceae bacterium]
MLAVALAGVLLPSRPRRATTSSSARSTAVAATAAPTYTHDFVELFNRGSDAVSLAGWSVQYAAASGTNWSVTPLDGVIAPGGYFLVQQAQGGDTPLPAPDVIGSQAMAADKEGRARAQPASPARTTPMWRISSATAAPASECGRRTQIVQHHRGPAARRRLPNTERQHADFQVTAPATAATPEVAAVHPPTRHADLHSDFHAGAADATPTATETATFTPTATSTATPTVTFTPTLTPTVASTATFTPTACDIHPNCHLDCNADAHLHAHVDADHHRHGDAHADGNCDGDTHADLDIRRLPRRRRCPVSPPAILISEFMANPDAVADGDRRVARMVNVSADRFHCRAGRCTTKAATRSPSPPVS